MERYNLIKEDTVFIDDTEENVLKAIMLGINGIVLKDSQCLSDELKRFNINI